MHRDLFNIYVFAHFTCFTHLVFYGMWISSHKEKLFPTEGCVDAAFLNLCDFPFHTYTSSSRGADCCVGAEHSHLIVPAAFVRKPIAFPHWKCPLSQIIVPIHSA